MLVAFVPVLHQGYLELFSKYGNELGILGPDIISGATPLTRDLRVVDPFRMKSAVEALGIAKKTRVLMHADLVELRERSIVMPDDEYSRELSATYSLSNVTFVPFFLRWTKMAATAFKTPEGERRMSRDAFDREIMQDAFTEATQSSDWWRQIGAVIVKDGKIMAQGHNHHLPTDFHLA
ncbi:MAG: hypothetical protein NUV56_00005, partial [Candidatus Uhrbacteria bacterium]|nr:hypothetical protein [Candidatus Uhrbacteria bacterium]